MYHRGLSFGTKHFNTQDIPYFTHRKLIKQSKQSNRKTKQKQNKTKQKEKRKQYVIVNDERVNPRLPKRGGGGAYLKVYFPAR